MEENKNEIYKIILYGKKYKMIFEDEGIKITRSFKSKTEDGEIEKKEESFYIEYVNILDFNYFMNGKVKGNAEKFIFISAIIVSIFYFSFKVAAVVVIIFGYLLFLSISSSNEIVLKIGINSAETEEKTEDENRYYKPSYEYIKLQYFDENIIKSFKKRIHLYSKYINVFRLK